MVQLRDRGLQPDELAETALAVKAAVGDALLLVNGDTRGATLCGADGVHLGQSDDLVDARERLGRDRILGISVAGVAQAITAVSMGADYLGVTVWSTPTKPEATGRGPVGISDVLRSVAIPVVGIGGITRENFAAVFEAGASGIAVISAVAGQAHPVAATRDLRRRIDLWEEVTRGTTNRQSHS